MHWSKHLPGPRPGILPIANSIENMQRKLEVKEMQIIRKCMRRGYTKDDIHVAMAKAGLVYSLQDIDEIIDRAWEGVADQ